MVPAPHMGWKTAKSYHVDAIGSFNFMVNGESLAQNWRFRSELDRRNYEADRAHVIEGRTDDGVKSATVTVPQSEGGHFHA